MEPDNRIKPKKLEIALQVTEQERRTILSKFEEWKESQAFTDDITASQIYSSYRKMLIRKNTNSRALGKTLEVVRMKLEENGATVLEYAVKKR